MYFLQPFYSAFKLKWIIHNKILNFINFLFSEYSITYIIQANDKNVQR